MKNKKKILKHSLKMFQVLFAFGNDTLFKIFCLVKSKNHGQKMI